VNALMAGMGIIWQGYKLTDSNVFAKLQRIDQKIEKHKEHLAREIKFSDTIAVNRKELELNQALYHGTESEENKKLNHLIEYKETSYPVNDPVIATLKHYDEEQSKQNQKKPNKEESFIGPELSDVNTRVVAIPKDVIFKSRINLDEILAMEKFKEYKAGKESHVLYIKNISKNVIDKDLARLFCRFYSAIDNKHVKYKVMKGRMRGQAFVTFSDEHTAKEALLLCNGYKLYDKPIIISYGKSAVT